jgi:hypothetical protein
MIRIWKVVENVSYWIENAESVLTALGTWFV